MPRRRGRQRQRQPENRWSMYPNLHDAVANLIQDENLDFSFRATFGDDWIQQHDTHIMGTFQCHNSSCETKGWSSKKIAIVIRSYYGGLYNAKVYHQRCRQCNELSRPELDGSYAERVAYRLKVWCDVEMERLPFGEKTTQPPHLSDLCEGCKDGHFIYQYAGLDATEEYNKFHAPSLIQKALDAKHHIGSFDVSSTSPERKSTIKTKPENTNDAAVTQEKPPLGDIINLDDFQRVASSTLSPKAWAYISGAANDNLTRDANYSFLKRIWLRPAVMRDVATVTAKTTLFGCPLDIPVYIAPTGTVRTAGEEGELALARGAGSSGIIHCLSTPSSYPHDEVFAATPKHAFLQLYVNKDRGKSEALVRLATSTGKVKAIFVTADLPVVSKREADERVKAPTAAADNKNDWKGAGLARQTGSFIDPSLDWGDLSWLRGLTDLPIVIKGVQRWEDAVLAARNGCDGIVLSNHGGRAADTAPPSIVLLLELHRNCPEVFEKLVVLVDGGFRRGSDVVKAVCLGARAVGMGRPFFYAVNYGRDGVEHAVNVLKDEMETAMRLCGMTDLMRDASPDYVNTSDIDHHVTKGGHPYARKRGLISRL